jgi:hypothetical protein
LGKVTSAAAKLTVTATVSPLAGRAWTVGQALEANDNDVLAYDARIDDSGAVTVLFIKSDGSRKALYAARGTPQPTGSAPNFDVPVLVDAAAPIDENAIFQFRMGVAPGGNVVVTWTHLAACNATSYNTSGVCIYRYVARYLVATGNWEAPLLMGSDPSLLFDPPVINDRGDVMVNSQNGWIRSGSGGYTIVPAVMWRSASQGAFRQQSFDNSVSNLRRFMDNAGHLLVVASAAQNATTDIVAYRGNVDDGLGTQEVLDTRLSAATLAGAWAGTNGQAVVFWLQNDGTSLTGTAAAIDAPAGTWSLAQVPSIYDYYVANSPNTGAVVTDGGDFILYTEGGRLRRTGGVWSAREPFTAMSFDINSIRSALNRDGSVLQVRIADNAWSSFDGQTSQVVSAFPPLVSGRPTGPGYVYGVSAGDDGLVLLSKSGVGAKVTRNTYDILPAPAFPAGDGRNVFNLWGLYFK